MEKSIKHGVVIASLLVVLILLGGYMWVRSHSSDGVKEAGTAANVDVTNTALPGQNKTLPDGFPADIPVQSENIVESYKVVYKDRGVIQYTVSFTSSATQTDLMNVYKDFFARSGVVTDTTNSNTPKGQLVGLRKDDTLTIVVSPRGEGSYVQITVLHK